jgi:hypothetical protein
MPAARRNALDPEAARQVAARLPADAIDLLCGAPVSVTRETDRHGRSNRLGRASRLFS